MESTWVSQETYPPRKTPGDPGVGGTPTRLLPTLYDRVPVSKSLGILSTLVWVDYPLPSHGCPSLPVLLTGRTGPSNVVVRFLHDPSGYRSRTGSGRDCTVALRVPLCVV